MSSEEMSDKKRALLAYKNKLLNDLHYCEKRIEETKKKHAQTYYDDEDSSDSDTGFPVPVKRAPTLNQLRAETSQLTLRLQATQELTSLQIHESEVNVLVNPPKLKDGIYPDEEGTWREVLAECKVDLVPYCITYYIFQPSKPFGNPTYYQLRVTPTKSAHERELANSILSKLTRPSDAWHVLRSYSVASRSRRTTIARLCDKFGDALVVDPAVDGGFAVKCANLLEITWSLQNIWSSVMPFQHKMKFDLEYMDENYIKAIKHAHKQLSDPSLETDERTDILTNIIKTCIEASGNVSSVTESETDQSVHLTPVKRRTTLEEEPEIPVKKRTLNKGGTELVMPPPKGVPKKTKTKDKENVNLNCNGLELQENKGSSKTKSLVRDSLNKDGNPRNKHDDFHRDSLKPNEKGGPKEKVTENIKNNEKTKTKEVAKETIDSDNLKKNKENIGATKSKAEQQPKDSEITSNVPAENKQKKSSQTKEKSAKVENVTNKKTSVTELNEKREKTNENRKKTSAENDTRQKTSENRQKTNDNRQKTNEKQPKLSQPTLKEDRPKTSDSRQKPIENNTQKNKYVDKLQENRQKEKDVRQKQPETDTKANDNRQKTNEDTRRANDNGRKPNEIEKQKEKGKNDKTKNFNEKHDKLKTVSKIPKLFKDNFKPQNFISKRLSGRIDKNTNDKGKNNDHFEKKISKTDSTNLSYKNNMIVKKKYKAITENDHLKFKSDKYGVSKTKIVSSVNVRK